MNTTFFVEINRRYYAIKFDDVLYIFGTRCKSKIVTKSRKYNVPISLDAFEGQLPRKLFCKVHECYLAAVKNINSFDHDYALFGDISIPINTEGFQNIVNRLRKPDQEIGRSLGDANSSPNWQLLIRSLREFGNTSNN